MSYFADYISKLVFFNYFFWSSFNFPVLSMQCLNPKVSVSFRNKDTNFALVINLLHIQETCFSLEK